ncbi:MAG: DNA topoisomerase IV subunit A [Myxococcales bacterium]|nr:DNA topoisomerase IV subunit A [Myxococcota bacterium]MDW8281896.1 DNA topoisomerase IV subunit A [Myxococcales bacterium]
MISDREQLIALDEETQRRYLNYALSVITARALPDVRDGLKPVQRRILYAMFHDQRLRPDARYRKCAAVVGDVLGKYHPHGDTSVYEALVRMAQDFSLRYPLIDGHGNFGSLDGDAPAAYRYTECRLRPMALELLEELGQSTVDWRPTFDGVRMEPVVLPARLPNLLLNGAQGIAVGMATSIPPHNVSEIIDACMALIDDPNLSTQDLLRYVRGPDFPTGGEILASKQELREIYEQGHGSVKLRGTYRIEEPADRRGAPSVVITSIPYGPTRASIMEKIGEIISQKKLPQLVDCRDESTTDVRMVLELKRGADPALVLAYLYKHTALQINVQINLTCLVPTDNPEVGAPRQLSLAECLRQFLRFRFDVITRRLSHELSELNRRIHVLEGFALIYDALDEVLKLIRKSEGKADAAQQLMRRFSLDEEQAEAILELKLYRLARLEILAIQKELEERQRERRRLEGLLRSEDKRWALLRRELAELRERYADKRRTRIGVLAEEVAFDPEAFIVAEDTHVVLTRDGWIKRVGQLKDVGSTRVREGDEVVAVLAGSTRETVAFFSNFGSAYVCRIVDVPASSGYGDPVQKLFKLSDGERVVSALCFDPRVRPQAPHLLAMTRRGLGLRFAWQPHAEPSTRSGRRFARPAEGDEVLGVRPAPDDAIVAVVSRKGHALCCLASDIHVLSGPGRGVQVIKLAEDDQVIAFSVGEPLTVESDKGKVFTVGLASEVVGRGGRGRELIKRGQIVRVQTPPPTVPQLAPLREDDPEAAGRKR